MIIRPATLDDAPAILAIYTPYVLNTSISFETQPPTLQQMCDRITMGLDHYGYFVVEDRGHVCGYAYGSAYRPRAAYGKSAEVSIYLSETAKGRGYGQALYGVLIDHLTGRGFHTVIGIVTTPNLASDRLHQACGFTLVGTLQDVGKKFGVWHGTSLYQRMIGIE
ncbi:MAG: GNAT family N-acetyltransferase [Planktomarina sp.]